MTGRSHTNPTAFLDLLDEQPNTVRLSAIRVMPEFNPRTPLLGEDSPFTEEALANLTLSIREQGVLQPLLVRPVPGGYELIAGERRYHAARFAGLNEVPVHIRELTPDQARRAALTENGQRQDLPYAQEALMGLRDIARMSGLPLEEVPSLLLRLKNGAEDEFGISEYLRGTYGESVSNWAQRRAVVLRLTAAELQALNRQQVNLSALKLLVRLGDLPARGQLLEQLMVGGLTAEALAETVKTASVGLKPAPHSAVLDLRRHLTKLSRLDGTQRAEAERLAAALMKLLPS